MRSCEISWLGRISKICQFYIGLSDRVSILEVWRGIPGSLRLVKCRWIGLWDAFGAWNVYWLKIGPLAFWEPVVNKGLVRDSEPKKCHFHPFFGDNPASQVGGKKSKTTFPPSNPLPVFLLVEIFVLVYSWCKTSICYHPKQITNPKVTIPKVCPSNPGWSTGLSTHWPLLPSRSQPMEPKPSTCRA